MHFYYVHMTVVDLSYVMTQKAKQSEPDYGGRIVKERFFALVYAVFVTLILCGIGATGGDAPFARIDTMASTGVGFLGLFIALWWVIRERNKKIKEGYFYKVGILWHIERMVDTVALFYSEVEYVDIRKKQLRESDVSEEQMVKSGVLNENLKESCILDYQYHQRQAELININAFVPAMIRANISLLIRKGSMPISFYLKNNVTSNKITVQDKLLKPLGQVIDSKYFVDDHTDEVRTRLTTINHLRDIIKEYLGL